LAGIKNHKGKENETKEGKGEVVKMHPAKF